MSLSKLSARCQACPFVDTCDNKEMEALEYLPIPEPAAQPTEKGYRNVENLWSNPQMLIGFDPASGGMLSMGGLRRPRTRSNGKNSWKSMDGGDGLYQSSKRPSSQASYTTCYYQK